MATSTASFLMDCPQCGVMIPKGGPCSDCHWSENAEVATEPDQDFVQAFAARRQVHVRNYAIFMILAFAAGFLGLITAVLWCMVIYLGDVGAFLLIGLLTVVSGIVGVIAAWARKQFPTELHCPACNIRLDEIGTDGGHCPNCSTRLR